MHAYQGGGGVKKPQKYAYVICESPLRKIGKVQIGIKWLIQLVPNCPNIQLIHFVVAQTIQDGLMVVLQIEFQFHEKMLQNYKFWIQFHEKMFQVPIPMLLEKLLIGLFVLTLIASYIWMCKYGIVEDSICIFFRIHHYYLHLVNLDIVQIKERKNFYIYR